MGPEIEAMAADMERIAVERNDPAWANQARIIAGAEAVVLIGARGTKSYVTNCGACGYKSCADFTNAEKRIGAGLRGSHLHL